MDVKSPSQAFCEIPHSADIAIEVTGENLNQLFMHAAEGLFHVMGIETISDHTSEKEMEIQEGDKESLLVAFLSELIYEAGNGIYFRALNLQVEEKELHARLAGFPILRQQRDIKAVTYHQASVEKTEDGWKARVVFDV